MLPLNPRTDPSMKRVLIRFPPCRLPGIPYPSPRPLDGVNTQLGLVVLGQVPNRLDVYPWPYDSRAQPSSDVPAKRSPPADSANPIVLLVPSITVTIGIPLPVPLLYWNGPR